RIGHDHLRLADEAVELVQAALALVGREASVARTTFRALYRDLLGVDPMSAGVDALRAASGGLAIDPSGLTRGDWLDLLMTHRIQPRFPPNQLLVLHDYPASQCALAKVVRRGDVEVAERFELYLGALELANGYHELTDAAEQRRRFERDVQVRRARSNSAGASSATCRCAARAGRRSRRSTRPCWTRSRPGCRPARAWPWASTDC